jgi:hypothetical protein
MNNCWICWFFTHIFIGILIFKELIARRLDKSFGVKGLKVAKHVWKCMPRQMSVGCVESVLAEM